VRHIGIECKLDGNCLTIYRQGTLVAIIQIYKNHAHGRNAYLDLSIDDLCNQESAYAFKMLSSQLTVPLQVMLPSSKKDVVEKLIFAGFELKRKCYEMVVERAHFNHGSMNVIKLEEGLGITKSGKERNNFSNQLFARFKETHEHISPLTLSFKEFIDILPATVLYDKDEPRNFAYIEENEIAYVCGKDQAGFQKFSLKLLAYLLNQYEYLIFEADNTDNYAMTLLHLCDEVPGHSYDTYIKNSFDGKNGNMPKK
jgi:hypothetical protein